jgi:hypothetical protein
MMEKIKAFFDGAFEAVPLALTLVKLVILAGLAWGVFMLGWKANDWRDSFCSLLVIGGICR